MQFNLPEAGPWGEEKYRLVRDYAQTFATTMKGKWQCRVFIDLFAGAGRARIKESGKIVECSPLIAMGIENPFDRYIFCEHSSEYIDALSRQAKAEYTGLDTHFVHGDANNSVKQILAKIPPHSSTLEILVFCFVDPSRIDNLKFETLRRLSSKSTNFLVLIPTGMDDERNASNYLKPESMKVAEFIGLPDWRSEWRRAEKQGETFSRFIIRQFCASMHDIGYKCSPPEDSPDNRLPDNDLSTYRHAFFSKHHLGHRFRDNGKVTCLT
jgi:three-Cys-motif partner protein